MNNLMNATEVNEKCSIGILLMENVQNEASDNKLMVVRQELEEKIRSSYAGVTRGELKALHPMAVYTSYYKQYGYNYHVLHQLESVIKGKTISRGLPLVEAMFMAEVKNMILTAGHDYDKIRTPLELKISAGDEIFKTIDGKDTRTISGDFMLADQETIISSILRGPDQRTAITENTKNVIYTVYAPVGVEKKLVKEHLKEIETYVHMISEKAVTQFMQVY